MTIKRLLTGVLVLGCIVVPIASAAKRQHPTVTNFGFAPSKFSVTSSPSASAAASRSGTTIRFHLAHGSAVDITVTRVLPGRKVGSRCVKPTSRLSKHRACTRTVTVGAITRGKLSSGNVSIPFGGRLGGHMLPAGRYRATIVARDRRHHRSKSKRATFSIVRARGAAVPPTQAPAPPTSSPAPPAPGGFPNSSNTGVPRGWTPRHTTNGDMTITQAGTVLDGELVTGTLNVNARNVTVKNSWVYGSIDNQQYVNNVGVDNSGLLIQDSDVGPPSGNGAETFPAVLVAGYTMRRVHVHNMSEGPRLSAFNGNTTANQTVDIEDSLVQIVKGTCSHNDGIQGYGEPPRVILNHNTVDTRDAGPDCVTGALFIGNDNPDLLTVTNNLLAGGGWTMRIGGPGSDGPGGTYDHVSGNKIVNNSWGYGPVVVDDCKTVHDWSNNSIVTVDSNYQVTSTVKALNSC